jgi:hypothetical protein
MQYAKGDNVSSVLPHLANNATKVTNKVNFTLEQAMRAKGGVQV